MTTKSDVNFFEVSPRGFANETFVVSYEPQYAEDANWIIDSYANDVNADVREVSGPGRGRVSYPLLDAIFDLRLIALDKLPPRMDEMAFDMANSPFTP